MLQICFRSRARQQTFPTKIWEIPEKYIYIQYIYIHADKSSFLVGGFNPLWKICSSNWIISQWYGMNIKKKIFHALLQTPNHQLDFNYSWHHPWSDQFHRHQALTNTSFSFPCLAGPGFSGSLSFCWFQERIESTRGKNRSCQAI